MTAGMTSGNATPPRIGFKSIPTGMEARATPAARAPTSMYMFTVISAPPTIMSAGRRSAHRAPSGSKGPRPDITMPLNGAMVM